uniref:Uncharacterized protein n=1 Tax=Glossina palpalis gambiensis TaxID=67801 RepID=A0A1B0BS40_9MUSC
MTLMRRIVVGITNTRCYNSVVAVIIVINKLNTSLQRRYGIMHNPNLFCMRMRALVGYLYSSSNALYSAVFSCFFFGLATGELS